MKAIRWMIVAAVFCSCAWAGGAAPLKATLQKRYDAQSAAMARKDVKAYLSFFTSDYTQISSKGDKVTISELKAKVPALFSHAKKIQSSTKIRSLKQSAKTAIAKVVTTGKLVLADNTGKEHVIGLTDESTDDWVLAGKEWKLKRQHSTKTESTVDGKRVGGK